MLTYNQKGDKGEKLSENRACTIPYQLVRRPERAV